ncbi:MAG: pyridoxal phosphate-dependent aminotransferase [candidate division Zixibacteria bacterium]|nr:pyridoxal phosphate-dependent aminotransferase [candidate division Zixibacteria bacterium]
MRNKKIIIDKANRLHQMPPDILSFIQTESLRPLLKKPDLIDLATFTWPVPFESYGAPSAAELQPASKEQLNNLKEELITWFDTHHLVRLKSTKELFIGSGIRTLLFNLALSFLENGDVAFVPELGLPLYRKIVTACGAEPINYNISAKNNWSPGFDRLNTHLGRVARVLFLNSPHNPTGFELNEKEMAELAWLAGRENFLVVNDAAYQSLSERKPVSLLSVSGGRKVGVELYSFSYLFGLPPLPFGFIAGNREVINAIKQSAGLLPSYIPAHYINLALQAVRKYPSEPLRKTRKRISQAASEANQFLSALALEKAGSATVPFIWAEIGKREQNSTVTARQLYRRHRILTAPGTAFGESGQGYLRLSLTAPPELYIEAAGRLRRKIKILKKKDNQ